MKRITLSEGISAVVYETHSGLGVTLDIDAIIERSGGHCILGNRVSGMTPTAALELSDRLRTSAMSVLGKLEASDAQRVRDIAFESAMAADEREVAL